jgi:hypothetical protein
VRCGCEAQVVGEDGARGSERIEARGVGQARKRGVRVDSMPPCADSSTSALTCAPTSPPRHHRAPRRRAPDRARSRTQQRGAAGGGELGGEQLTTRDQAGGVAAACTRERASEE